MIILQIISDKAEFLVGAVALFLSIRAYVSSERSKYENTKSLLLSFKNELEFQSSWLSGIYTEKHNDPDWFSPQKIVFVLSFETAKELSRRGVSDSKFIQSDFYKKLARFNERIDAFNNAVQYQQDIISSNPILSQKLAEYLKSLEKKYNKNIKFCDIYSEVNSVNIDEDIKLLAKQLYQGNKIIHSQLIGDGSQSQYLNYLYRELNKDIDEVVNSYESKLPIWFRKISSFKIC